MKLNSLIFLLSITLAGCFHENEYVIKPLIISEVKIPYSMYESQTYFNLSSSMIVSHNNYADWDLGFESTRSGYHIILNTSKFMYAGNTGQTDFSSVKTPTVDTMTFDNSNGDLDSTAIGNWVDFSDVLNPIYPKKVYIINRGVDENGVSFGFKKIVFEKLENNTYFIHFANLDNSEEFTYQIPKNASVNFVQFSFDGGGNLNTQQPDKALWDLCFTKYTSILFDGKNNPVPYMLRGVLINNGLSVAKDSVSSFISIKYSDIANFKYSSKKDAIGYDWKLYKNDIYSIVDRYSYIIKDSNNNYYKLRFTGFYNNIDGDVNIGKKGYPSFEIIKLENN